ncbi:carboxymuconolactone decarboxylase family protein [Pseudonocardiaceae bacterium YIM PH 21723]|nr:carboxymuconolactone decarboxylase family protein [Pseudonocardiaceae bacterium YIM PH 21723]
MTRPALGVTQPEIYQAFIAVNTAVQKAAANTGIEPWLLHLINIRTSQLNGCAFCNDMHTREARRDGATDNHLLAVATWQESPRFSERERAVLTLAESVTRIWDGYLPDAVYAAAKDLFSEEQIGVLVSATISINSFNRIALAGRYQVPAKHRTD